MNNSDTTTDTPQNPRKRPIPSKRPWKPLEAGGAEPWRVIEFRASVPESQKRKFLKAARGQKLERWVLAACEAACDRQPSRPGDALLLRSQLAECREALEQANGRIARLEAEDEDNLVGKI